jgi:hypothetical protein
MNRTDLKHQLLDERGDTCDYCGKAGATDMHEWLIKRSTSPRNSKIFDARNCALLHHEPCHMQFGQTKQLKQRLANIFIERYGEQALLQFINGLNLRSDVEYKNIVTSMI